MFCIFDFHCFLLACYLFKCLLYEYSLAVFILHKYLQRSFTERLALTGNGFVGITESRPAEKHPDCEFEGKLHVSQQQQV